MIKEFNNLEEIKKYYDKETNTYIFKEDGVMINLIKFNFDLNIRSSIYAWNIIARDIKVRDINAYNINAYDIKADCIIARDINACYIYAWCINAHNIIATDIRTECISYYAICFVYKDIKCKSIEGRRLNAKAFVLDGKLEIEED